MRSVKILGQSSALLAVFAGCFDSGGGCANGCQLVAPTEPGKAGGDSSTCGAGLPAGVRLGSGDADPQAARKAIAATSASEP